MEASQQIADCIISVARDHFKTNEFIPLHAPLFNGNEKKYVLECIESTFVSSAGAFVTKGEEKISQITDAKYAIATTSGTLALDLALKLVGVERDTEVITQPLTFVATCNAISYQGAIPVFVDVSKETLGMSPKALRDFINENVERTERGVINKKTNRIISACMPMHTFGNPCEILEIAEICHDFNIPLIEDSAESIGSYFKGRHTGLFGTLGVISLNGNKTITSGGGGYIITNNQLLAEKAKFLSTTAKEPHKWDYFHSEVGYNYRMPNINAALALAQMEQLDSFLRSKKELANKYKQALGNYFFSSPYQTNNWLNTIVVKSKDMREEVLERLNKNGIMARPAWELMYKLPMYKNSPNNGCPNSDWLADRLINIPSSATKAK